jgi:hypothetical protein
VPVTTPKAPSAGEFKDGFARDEITLRGVTYKFRELSVAEYDDIVKMCSSTNEAGEELIDNRLLSQMMTVESCETPKMTTEKMRKLGMRLSRKLNNVASSLNYGDEPEDKPEKEPDVQEGEPEEGKA